MKPIRVLLVDDERMLCEGLTSLLGQHDGLQVVGEMQCCTDAVKAVSDLQPDVIAIGLATENLELGLQCLRQLREAAPVAKILVLSQITDTSLRLRMVLTGCIGILAKHATVLELATTIRRMTAGEAVLDPKTVAALVLQFGVESITASTTVLSPVVVSNQAISQQFHPNSDEAELAKIARLTEREREVIGLIGEGLRNQQVADRLSISVITVRHHLSSIFAKLDVGDRFELAIYAYRNGLAKLPL